MSIIQQRTLKRTISMDGIGLHSGNPVRVTLRPAPVNRGIVFIRSDLRGAPEIQAHFKNVVNTRMATTLGVGPATLSTVEHLMAALSVMEIDNVICEIDGPEVPIMDGSSAPFCEAILKAGIEMQRELRPVLALRRKVELKLAEKWAVAEPSSRFEIFGSIDWDHPAIGYQEFHFIEGKTKFSELASARTFGFLKDYEALKRMGLARGGSLENAVVLDQVAILNAQGLRFPDEFARHKVLDALGDFKLSGFALQGFFRLHRAGHDLHNQLLCEIFRDPNNFEIIESTEDSSEELRIPLRPAIAAAV